MEIVISDEIGFCSGVRLALKKLDELTEKEKNTKIYSIGEIIHNQDVIDHYKNKGVIIAKEIEDTKDGIGVVRAHGLPLSMVNKAKEEGYRIIDATCPFVRKISAIIEEEVKKGFKIFLVGEENHPEVIASSYDYKENITIIDYKSFNPENFDFKLNKCAIISQTTLEEEVFIEIAKFFLSHCYETHIYNTICPATKKRQRSAVEVAKNVDLMIVLGGKNSSNTKRLYEKCSREKKTLHLERITEIKPDILKNVKKVGITAGTSTPDWIIEEAIEFLKRY
ncbi:MAG: 4-hydroxy-3-methylbut-2-enyl diphosphate reductase [Brevinematales bacterium]|nr:4-hydroxy-3-methylbut-2-enyl diphosphate reductase [Brevinematales bacterium]